MRTLLLLFCFGVFLATNSQTTDTKDYTISYGDTAIKILEDGTVLSGKETIEKWYQNNPMVLVSFETVFSVAANEQFDYAIGAFDSAGKHYKQIIITDTKQKNTRVFEVIARAHDTATDIPAIIDVRRDEWIKLCNTNNARDLVTQLYAEEPVYYNHRPPVTDPDILIQVYSYMNNPNYSLQLQPLHVETVSDNLVFEIGQCSGSYNGKYILVWEKATSGAWYVKIDSNI